MNASPSMTLEEALRGRRSVRGFLRDRPVPRELLERALELAQHSPSNCNAQPWQVFLAEGEACDRIRRRLVAAAQAAEPPAENPTPAFTGTLRQRQIACAVELYTKIGVGREDRAGRQQALIHNFELFGAPCLAVLGMDRSFGAEVALDVGIYLQSLMLALYSLGIGSCPQASLRCYPHVLREEMGIDEQLRILVGVSIGYEDPAAMANRVRQPRADPAENCKWVG